MRPLDLGKLREWDTTETQLLRYNLLIALASGSDHCLFPNSKDDPRQFQLIPNTYIVPVTLFEHSLFEAVLAQLKLICDLGNREIGTIQLCLDDLHAEAKVDIGPKDIHFSWQESDDLKEQSRRLYATIIDPVTDSLVTFPTGNQMRFRLSNQ